MLNNTAVANHESMFHYKTLHEYPFDGVKLYAVSVFLECCHLFHAVKSCKIHGLSSHSPMAKTGRKYT